MAHSLGESAERHVRSGGMSMGLQVAGLVSFVVLQALGTLFTRYHLLFLLRFEMATIQCSAVRTDSHVQSRGVV
jgi:hypothetical protein